ncbi:hypothetical protein V2J09_023738 [Rumex salicifolius]
MQSPICGKCGDKGYEETLICCYMCQDAYEHRYCFNKESDILKRDVKWACEDCLPTIRKKPSPKKIWNLPSRRSERLSTKNSPAKKADFATKTVGEISPPSAKRTKQKNENGDKAEQLESPNSDGSVVCNNVLEKNGNKDIQAHSEIERSKQSLSNLEEAKSHSGGTLWIDLPGSPPIGDKQSSGLQKKCNLNAQPIMDPIWKGSFMISYKKLSKVGGVAAHLSTLACPKAQQEAKLLPVALKPRVVPRSTVWPKSFQEAEPKDESIGLYFFAECNSDALAFDALVHEMISEDLAMICVVKNAELLVFTSIKLPCDYWSEFQAIFLFVLVSRKALLMGSVQGETNSLDSKGSTKWSECESITLMLYQKKGITVGLLQKMKRKQSCNY